MKQKKVFSRILRYARPHLGYLIGGLVSAGIGVTLSLLAPVWIGDAIDRMVGKGQVDFDSVRRIILILTFTILFSALFQWVVSICTNTVAFQTAKDIRTDTFDKLNRVPLNYIDSNSHGDIMARVVTDIDQISDGLLQGFTQLFTGIITILGTLIFMVSINFKIALIVVLVTPLSLFVAGFIGRRIHRQFRKQAVIRGELGGYVEELVGSQKIVKAFGYEKRAQDTFEEINDRLYECGVKAQFYSAITNPGTRFVNAIVYLCVGVFGAISVVQGHFSVGRLSVFLSYANQYTKPFNEITGVLGELQSALASARRVFELLDEAEESDDSKLAVLSDTDGTVTLGHVDFSYRPPAPLIQDLNLSVRPGQRIALVGPTGCGKTTIINLLMRFYDVTGGEIRVSGKSISKITRSSLRAQYGMVLQETWLFTGTIRENIAYGKEDATEEEIIQAAKMAHAHGFIQRLENGYDTIISEDGEGISQGQKQLLCIARVMLRRPPMLILDEATSSIDTRTEVRIQSAFSRMMKGRTSFIVAHRLSTIREADVILVMNQGNVIEQGTHESLMAQGGFYHNLYNSQFEQS